MPLHYLGILIPVILVATFGWDAIKDARKKAQKAKGFALAEASAEGFAARLGLQYKPSSSLKNLGKMVGTFRGRKVTMGVFDKPTIKLQWSGDANYELALCVEPPDSRPEEEMVEFTTPSSDFDKTFGQRYASAKIADAFSRDPRLAEVLLAFSRSDAFDLDDIEFEHDVFSSQDGGLSCTLIRSPHYDEERLTVVLDEMGKLMDAMRPLLNAT